jgi:hypothetical protein
MVAANVSAPSEGAHGLAGDRACDATQHAMELRAKSEMVLPAMELADADDPLRLDGNRPIWPVRGRRERRALERLARLLGTRLRWTRGRPGRSVAGAGEVVSLGSQFAAQAELYAHLTGRSWRMAEDLAHLCSSAMPAVLLAEQEAVDQSLLELLYEGTLAGHATGLLVAGSPADMRIQVLIRSAASVLRTVPVLSTAFVWPLVSMGYEQLGRNILVGGQANPRQTRSALRAGAGVLHVHTHSDGVDAELPAGLVLCPMRELLRRKRPGTDDAPACLVTGFCHRLDVPLAEALRSSRTLKPTRIAARVLMLDTCWGLQPPFGLVGARWASSGPLLEGGTVGAIVTTWEICLTSPLTSLSLVEQIVGGRPLGEALTAFARAGREQGNDVRFCLLGDPAMRVGRDTASPPRAIVRADQRSGAEGVSGASAFLRAHLLLSRQSARAPEVRLGDEALAALARCELAAWTGQPLEGDPEGLGPAMRAAVLRYLLARGSIPSKTWNQFTLRTVSLDQRLPCLTCGRITRGYLMDLRQPGPTRRLRNCPRCGQIEDAPADLELGLRVDSRGDLHLHGDFPCLPWAGGLLVVPPRVSLRKAWAWPEDERGSPTRTLSLPEPWPAGPVRATLIFVLGSGTIACLGVAHRNRGAA